jgi:hypothetical protein
MYSIRIGLGKALLGIIAGIGMWLTFVGLSDVTLWSLAEMYVKPVFGSVTAAGAILFAHNAVKYYFKL